MNRRVCLSNQLVPANQRACEQRTYVYVCPGRFVRGEIAIVKWPLSIIAAMNSANAFSSLGCCFSIVWHRRKENRIHERREFVDGSSTKLEMRLPRSLCDQWSFNRLKRATQNSRIRTHPHSTVFFIDQAIYTMQRFGVPFFFYSFSLPAATATAAAAAIATVFTTLPTHHRQSPIPSHAIAINIRITTTSKLSVIRWTHRMDNERIEWITKTLPSGNGRPSVFGLVARSSLLNSSSAKSDFRLKFYQQIPPSPVDEKPRKNRSSRCKPANRAYTHSLCVSQQTTNKSTRE